MNTEPKLNRRMVKWIGIWAVWTLFAFFFTSQFALQNQLSKNPVSFWQILSWQMVSGYVWFALSPLILWLAQKFPLEAGRWRKSVPIHLVASVAVALFQQAIDTFALTRLGYPPNRQFATFLEAYQFFVFVNLHLSILIYWCVLGIKYTVSYYQKYRERELQTSQLQARLAMSRLQVLKMQLHPHFLFNTLNAISELIYKDPESAERMIGDLSDLLRMSFQNLEVQEITLKQELEFLRKYLEIEQMRFHDRLKVEMKIAPETLDAQVPNMILQPLVENAIKHGLAPRSEGGKIEIDAQRSNGHLQITVSDDGIGVPFNDVENLPEGVGLSNTRKRLRHLYGEQHKFDLATSAQKSGLKVNLTIPFKESFETRNDERGTLN
ncbi:MAG: histidine kinase [Acidobacteriota bacterium]|nr:histidine kinase [Acidobacteriota bacterium]